ncbi:hypothetical protein HK405_007608 [Cladochytrium tenue]|nr:hypothetical protein HK405_007608 [Cladochytrium tenue]
MILVVDPAAASAGSGGEAILSAIQAAGAAVTVEPQAVPRSLRWRRRVTRLWHDDQQAWLPCPERVDDEPFALIRLPAADLAGLATRRGELARFATGVRRAFPGVPRPIVFLEGAREFLRARARGLDQRLRAELRAGAGAAATDGAPVVGAAVAGSRAELEAALLWLQVHGGFFVQASESPDDHIRYIVSFTATIATIPERMHRGQEALRLRFGDTVRSGVDRADIWRRVLMEVRPCTEPVAEAIRARFPSCPALLAAYAACASRRDRENLLADVQPVEAALEDDEPVDAALDDEEPVDAALDDEEPVDAALEDDEPVAAALDDEVPIDAALEDDEPVDAALEDEPVEAALDDDEPVDAALDDDEPVDAALDDDEPVAGALDDDDEPVDAALEDDEPVDAALDDDEPVDAALDDDEPQAAIVKECTLFEVRVSKTVGNADAVAALSSWNSTIDLSKEEPAHDDTVLSIVEATVPATPSFESAFQRIKRNPRLLMTSRTLLLMPAAPSEIRDEGTESIQSS